MDQYYILLYYQIVWCGVVNSHGESMQYSFSRDSVAYVSLSGALAISYTLMIPPVDFAVRTLNSYILYLTHTF